MQLVISIIASVLSLISLFISVKLWRSANRPIISLRVTSNGSAGNVATPLTLVVENTGNRPALHVSLSVERNDLDAVLVCGEDAVLRKEVYKIFSDRAEIAMLPNGKSVSNAFGLLSQREDCTWKINSRLGVDVTYRDLDGRKYKDRVPLVINDNDHFAGGAWNSSRN